MRTSLISLILYFSAFSAYAQVIDTSLVESFNKHAITLPVEKLYLHIDKPYYAAGEYIYLKAYLTTIHLEQEPVNSGIVYVELIDNKKQVVKRTLLYSKEKEFVGQILLPDTIAPANYHLRAYTNWMRNTNEDYYFHRSIAIGNNLIEREEDIQIKPDFDVSFFPEGGHLLSGIENKIAFKALKNDGLGTDISGKVIDSSGSEVINFSSAHLGMGAFLFTPKEGVAYKAIVESKGVFKEFNLPEPKDGLSLSMTQSADSIFMKIKSTAKRSERITIIAQSRHTTCYALRGIFRGDEERIAISKEKFPTGIAQFTLFKDDLPVSERLIFVDKDEKLNIEIIPDKQKYADREQVNLLIKATTHEGHPVKGDFSLSVTDDKVVTPTIESYNIKGALLLDSDLKGYIENPGWYFFSKEAKRKEALDILLCTQGWSRFIWEDVKTIKQPNIIYPVEEEFSIKGTLVNGIGKPVRKGSVTLLTNVKGLIPDAAETDERGRFGFWGYDCPDTAIFVLQGRNRRNHRLFMEVKLDPPTPPTPTTSFPLLHLSASSLSPENVITKNETKQEEYIRQTVLQRRYENNMWHIDLPEIEINTVRNKESQRRKIWNGMTGYEIGRESITDHMPMSSSVRKMPKGLTIEGRRPIIIPPEPDFVNILIVDGTQIDFNEYWRYYEKLPGSMFETLEIVSGTGRSIYGARGGSRGFSVEDFLIIKIEMRKYADFLNSIDVATPGLIVHQPEGYSVRKEFYMPAYDKPEVKQNPTPDLRTTIYWQPVIRTNDQGEAKVSFYTADQKETYTYIVEGIGNGIPAFAKQQ
jgi:hypothetical protein